MLAHAQLVTNLTTIENDLIIWIPFTAVVLLFKNITFACVKKYVQTDI